MENTRHCTAAQMTSEMKERVREQSEKYEFSYHGVCILYAMHRLDPQLRGKNSLGGVGQISAENANFESSQNPTEI